VSITLTFETVSRPVELTAAVREISGSGSIALDTESDSFHRYPERLCLIQVASRNKIYLIDTISLNDLDPLRNVLLNSSVCKIIHAAENDIRSLDRHCGIRIRNIYDTSLAARFAGIARLSLGALTEDLLGQPLNKSKRLQRADWGRRPLSAEALEYAASDVRHLHALREVLDRRLGMLGRTAWVAEECARLEEIRYTAPDVENAFFSVKGAKDLDERGLTVLRSLFLFREKEARRWHKPVFMVLPDAALILLASRPQTAFSEVLSDSGLKRFGQGLKQALYDGMAAPPVSRPSPVKRVRPRKGSLRRLNHLKEWRISLGNGLALDPSLIWPLASLERLAVAPDNLSIEIGSGEIRQWQRDTFLSSLQACLESLE
jgi:ribonuclease D